MSDFDAEVQEVQSFCEAAQQGKNDITNKYVGARVKLIVREEKRTYLSEQVYTIDGIYIDELIIDIIIDGKHFNQNDISIIEE